MRPKASRERDWEPYMRQALDLARRARDQGDVPVGALVVDVDGKVVAEGWNAREKEGDPTAHAEMVALRGATTRQGQWRLTGHTVVVTLEPCVMCAGALSLARVDRVVYGARDPRAGAMGSIYEIHADARLNHQVTLVSGVLESECAEILKDFFRSKRT